MGWVEQGMLSGDSCCSWKRKTLAIPLSSEQQREADAAIFHQETDEYMRVSDKTADQTDEQHAPGIDKLGQKRKSASDTSQLESPTNKSMREKSIIGNMDPCSRGFGTPKDVSQLATKYIALNEINLLKQRADKVPNNSTALQNW